MSRLAISLLGSLQVRLDGAPLSGFTSKKAQALMAYLAVETRAHQREELAGLFWPDYPESSARTSLRNVLANVRRVIDDRHASPPFLTISRQTIRVNPAGNIDSDVAIFDRPFPPEPFDPELLSHLEEAVAAIQGSFLAGFSLADSPAFEEWILLKREYFERQIGGALRRLTNHYAKEKAYTQALAHARRWVALDPWQEEAHRQVMRLLALSGRRSEALAHYATCRRALAEGLGIEPSDATTQLFRQIHDNTLRGEAKSAGAGIVRSAIPRPLTPLVGREQALAEVAELLADPNVRLLTLVGPGGIGKTHLALEAAAAQQSRFKHGVALVSLAPLASAAGMVSALAEALHFAFYENAPPEEQILDYLREKKLLLVMDNFEHLLDGAKLVTMMLATAPGLKILTTSRIRLQVRGEQLYPLAGLTYPAEGTQLEALLDQNSRRSFGALMLFVQQARRLQPDFALTLDTVADAIRICRLVEGMPLGIVLATAWIELLTPGEIADEIARSFTFLQAEGHGLPSRHQNLQAVFTHTWSLLSERDQRIFQQASVFRGGFTLDAAQAVIGAALPDLRALVGKFLLHRAPDGRYTIHELLCQFAAQELAQSAAEELGVRQRHSAFFSAYLYQRTDDLRVARQQQALAEIEAEGENIRVAWQWAVEHQQIAHLDQAINGLGIFYEWRGRYHDGEAACRAAAAMLCQIETGAAVRVLIRILTWQARFSRLQGQSERAGHLAGQSLHLLSEPILGDQDTRPERAATYLELGQQAENVADIQTWLERSLAIYRALDDAWGAAQALYLLGNNLGFKNDYTVYAGRLSESLHIRRALGDQRGIAEVLAAQGFCGVLLGQTAQGRQLLKESLAICQESGDRATLALTLARLGIASSFAGAFEEARRYYAEATTIYQDLGNRTRGASGMTLLSEATSHLGRYAEAQNIAEKAVKVCRAINKSAELSYALWFLGLATLAEGASSEAEQLLAESIAIHEEVGWLSRECDVRVTYGFAMLKSGYVTQTQQCLRAVLPIALKYHLFRTSVEGVALAACYWAARQEPERAVELYATAQRHPYIANSRWFDDVAGRQIATAAKLLADAAVSAAQTRGRSRDLWATVAELCEGMQLVEEIGDLLR